MVDVSQAAQTANKWRKKRGSLIMDTSIGKMQSMCL